MANNGKRLVCMCIESINVKFEHNIETIFKRRKFYCVIVRKESDRLLFKVYGDDVHGWNLTCDKEKFDNHFVLIKNSAASEFKQLRRDQEKEVNE